MNTADIIKLTALNLGRNKMITEKDTSSGITYVGVAAVGTLTSEARWRIYKVTETTVSSVTTTEIEWPTDEGTDPSKTFGTIFEWDERANYTYG